MKDEEHDGLTPEEQFQILENTVKALHRQIAGMIHLSARVDGLELMVAALGGKVGWTPAKTVEMLRKAQNTVYQKRLERVEDRNQAAAASVDIREAYPEIDENILRELKFDDEADDEKK